MSSAVLNAILLLASLLHGDPKNPRKVCEGPDLQHMAADFKRRGILVPLLVRRVGEGYVIIDGHRRRAAAILAGIEQVPCIVFGSDVTEAEIREAQLVSQLHSKALAPFEMYTGEMNWLALHPGASAKELAAAISCSEASVSRTLSLSRCIKPVQEAAAAGKIGLVDWHEISQVGEERQAELLAAKLNGASAEGLKRMRKKSDSASVRLPKIKIPLANETATGTVTVAGEDIDLEDAETLLKEALKAVRAAKDKNLDCKTAQSVWRDMANVG